jgi:hypothetical protein
MFSLLIALLPSSHVSFLPLFPPLCLLCLTPNRQQHSGHCKKRVATPATVTVNIFPPPLLEDAMDTSPLRFGVWWINANRQITGSQLWPTTFRR